MQFALVKFLPVGYVCYNYIFAKNYVIKCEYFFFYPTIKSHSPAKCNFKEKEERGNFKKKKNLRSMQFIFLTIHERRYKAVARTQNDR